MAKNNGRPNVVNKNNLKKGYFKEQQQRFGENFIEMKSSLDIQRDAIRIFRDIAGGRIDIQTDQRFFNDAQFLENCIIAASEQYLTHNVNYNGSLLLYNMYQDENIYRIMDNNMKCRDAYAIIVNALCGIRTTGNTQYLYVMKSQLAKYRWNI